MSYIAYLISQITPQGVLAGFILGGVLGFLAAREWYTAPEEDPFTLEDFWGEFTPDELEELEQLIEKIKIRERRRYGKD